MNRESKIHSEFPISIVHGWRL